MTMIWLYRTGAAPSLDRPEPHSKVGSISWKSFAERSTQTKHPAFSSKRASIFHVSTKRREWSFLPRFPFCSDGNAATQSKRCCPKSGVAWWQRKTTNFLNQRKVLRSDFQLPWFFLLPLSFSPPPLFSFLSVPERAGTQDTIFCKLKGSKLALPLVSKLSEEIYSYTRTENDKKQVNLAHVPFLFFSFFFSSLAHGTSEWIKDNVWMWSPVTVWWMWSAETVYGCDHLGQCVDAITWNNVWMWSSLALDDSRKWWLCNIAPAYKLQPQT